MSDLIVTVGEEGNPPVVIITPGETVLPTASVQVQTQEETPVVRITVDENSAQSAADSAEEVKAILEGLQSGPFVEKAEFAESNMTGDSYVHFSLPHYSSLRFVGDSTVFKGVYLFPGYKSYSGKKLTLKNFQTTDILLKHLANDPLLNTNLYFPNETDYILKPGKIIEFSLSMIANRFEFIGDSEDVSGKEDVSNKTGTVIGNEASTSFYLNLAGMVAYFQQKLTDVVFGAFQSVLPTITTVSDTDKVPFLIGSLSRMMTWLNFKAVLKSYFDTLYATISQLSSKQDLDNQIEISANSNVLNAWHGQTILFTASCTITVPASLSNSLMFAFRTLTGVTVTWAITSPFTWETTPIATAEKTTGHFMRRGSTNTIIIDA
jgi:hypothetical protein